MKPEVDLTTRYLGLELPHPFMPGASPMVDDMSKVRELKQAGAAAIVMHSLFEEQLSAEASGTLRHYAAHANASSEAASYMPSPDHFALGPDEYLDQIGRIKDATRLPVIGSLNGVTASGWTELAHLIQQAGADALELNIYRVVVDPEETSAEVEERVLRLVRAVRAAITIPLAVKLGPFYSTFAGLAHRLVEAGADGLVLFNRFYQPDLDPEELDISPHIELSTSAELTLRLQWLAILAPKLKASLAVTGGVHDARDAVKAVMAGAHAVQMVSALLHHGPQRLAQVREGLRSWLGEHGYRSISEARGALSLSRCPDPEALVRGNYVRLLQSFRT